MSERAMALNGATTLTTPPGADVTTLLRLWGGGDHAALDDLLSVVYSEMRRLARAFLARESPGHTLQGTALVHEVYLRMARMKPIEWVGRAQFFGIAGRMMRRILVEHARRLRAAKRGYGIDCPDALADAASLRDGIDSVDVVMLNSAIEELAGFDQRRAQVVELRFFGGLTETEIADALGVSEPTVRRDWVVAKAWLFLKMKGTPSRRVRPTGN
jgi:RNA polymerase sigma-70 factor, ECF subfamily